ncbi:hypothetical protein KFE25_003246 [Diacronema lutheri]|uniref:Uncharacterized protein n=1 Tax=Diacronema lutheri TaxID=2081491 RepID=A0A8J6CE48_DIALT|nr:hypothetical protein KFE25_003246 [Diacronema lutheri]
MDVLDVAAFIDAPEEMSVPSEEFFASASLTPLIMVNPCAQLDEKSSTRLAHDGYHLSRDRCTQVCIPERFKFLARLHGVSFGETCQHLGFVHGLDDESGQNQGVSYFNFARV